MAEIDLRDAAFFGALGEYQSEIVGHGTVLVRCQMLANGPLARGHLQTHFSGRIVIDLGDEMSAGREETYAMEIVAWRILQWPAGGAPLEILPFERSRIAIEETRGDGVRTVFRRCREETAKDIHLEREM